MSDHILYAAFQFLEGRHPAVIRVVMTNLTTGKKASVAQIVTPEDPCPWIPQMIAEGDVLPYSEDEQLILSAVQKMPTATLEKLVEDTGIERSRCSILHRNLKARNAC